MKIKPKTATPLKGWYKTARAKISDMGEQEFIDKGVQWLKHSIEKSKTKAGAEYYGLAIADSVMREDLSPTGQLPKWVVDVYGDQILYDKFIQNPSCTNGFINYFYNTIGGRIMRGFLHASALVESRDVDELVTQFLDDHADECPDLVDIYMQKEADKAIPKILYLRTKVKTKSILKKIDKALAELADINNISVNDILALAPNEFDLSVTGEYSQTVDGYKLHCQIDSHKSVHFTYIKPDGTSSVSPPKSLKEEFPENLKSFKKHVKSIQAMIADRVKKLGDVYRQDYSVSYSFWTKVYVDNSLMAIATKNLLWVINGSTGTQVARWNGGQFVGADNNPVTVSGQDTLSLWHPVNASEQELERWQRVYFANNLQQPFKQLFREFYRKPDSDNITDSDMANFSGYLLKKDTVAALAKAQGWTTTGLSSEDSDRVSFKFQDSQLVAEFLVEEKYLDEYSKVRGSAHIVSKGLQFVSGKKGVALQSIPATYFSEIMRDIDLFVAKSLLYLDVEEERNYENTAKWYWSPQFDFRLNFLMRICTAEGVDNKFQFEKPFIFIKNSKGVTRIHVGFGHIYADDLTFEGNVADYKPKKGRKIRFLPGLDDGFIEKLYGKVMDSINE